MVLSIPVLSYEEKWTQYSDLMEQLGFLFTQSENNKYNVP